MISIVIVFSISRVLGTELYYRKYFFIKKDVAKRNEFYDNSNGWHLLYQTICQSEIKIRGGRGTGIYYKSINMLMEQ